MNSETFAKFLKTPAYLYRVSYQELKSLVVQYPYCQNLRFLLLKKSQADGHEEYERNLQMAATYSAQRSLLYEQLYNDEVADIDRTSNADAEVILDLKDLNAKEEVRETEILYAQNEQESLKEKPALPLTDEPRKDLPSLDLPNAEEETEIGAPVTDEIPADSESGIDDIFAEIEAENSEAEEEDALDLTAHQISETVDLPDSEPEEITDPGALLDEIETEIEDLPPEALPESATDSDIEDLFREEPAPESPLPAESQLLTKKESAEEVPTVQEIIAENEAKTDPETPKDVTPSVHDLSEVTKDNEEEEDEYETETISPHSSFGAWLKQFNSPQISVEIEDLESSNRNEKVNYKYELIDGEWKQIKIKKKKKKKKKTEAELIAAESVKLSEEIATETLAQLLEKQGYYAKAIKMYERLSLEIPEKSNFFAAKIKTLQSKL